MAHDFEHMEMTDDQFELYQQAKNWFYEKCNGHPEDIISSLYDLLNTVVDAEKENA